MTAQNEASRLAAEAISNMDPCPTCTGEAGNGKCDQQGFIDASLDISHRLESGELMVVRTAYVKALEARADDLRKYARSPYLSVPRAHIVLAALDKEAKE